MPTLDEKLLVYYEKVSNYRNLHPHAKYIQETITSKKKS